MELADVLEVPKATFSTWNTHDRTSHELMVRLHLALGIPIEVLALSEEERVKLPPHKQLVGYRDGTTHIVDKPACDVFADQVSKQLSTVTLKSVCLSGGKLIDTGELPYPVRRINSFGLQSADLIELETNDAIMLVDKNDNDAVSGNYLISIDGRHSINEVQRLPGKKLAIAIGDSTMEVSEEDIEVVGRVAMEMK